MLEDLYADNLVDEPDDIERVIEGSKNENQNVSDKDSNNEEENNEGDKENKDKDASIIKIKKKLGPRIVLNPQRLKGPRGLGIMESFFGDIKLHGKGREREDLDLVLGRMEHWCHRLIPRMQFDDCLKKIEKIGTKKEVVNYVKRIRLGMEGDEVSDEVLRDEPPDSPPPPADPFDQLLSPSSVLAAPLSTDMTEEQRERMLRNRLIAEERRAARIKKAQEMKDRFQSQHSQIINNQAMEVADTETFVNGDGEVENLAVKENRPGTSETNFGIAVEGNEDQCAIFKGEYESRPDMAEKNENHLFNINRNENARDEYSERNDDQPDVIEGNDNQPDVLANNENDHMEREEIQLVNDVEGFENQPDVIMEINQSQPDVIRRNENQPDVLESNENQPDILLERNENELHENQPDVIAEELGNQPDILVGNENRPDVLVGRNENQPLENQPDVIRNENNGSQPDILM